MMTRARFQALSGAVSLAAFLIAAVLPGGGGASNASTLEDICGITTLEATIVVKQDGTLECGPPQEMVVREDLAEANPARESARWPVAAWLALADFQIVDAQSPLRGEWLDKCGTVSALNAAFRPHEMMVPHMLNAHARAASAVAANGSPILGKGFDFAVQLGDAADNQQYNEVRLFIDLLNGGKVVDPNSGGPGYEGVQGPDPEGGAPIESPTGESILDLATLPFWAHGLRSDGVGGHIPLPWYSVAGNHDIKVGGTIPDDNPVWREFARAWVVGNLKFNDLSPQHSQKACDDPTVLLDPGFWTQVALHPGTTRIVTPDDDRRLLDRDEWIAEHFETTGAPVGHGFAETNRCRDGDGNILWRACYSWDHQDHLHFVALDTASSEGLETGNIDEEQFAWLERDLIANSSRYHDEDGTLVETGNPDRLIVLLSHHTISTTTNTFGPVGEERYTGEDLKALALRFPNVILLLSGHTHANKVWAHTDPDLGTGFWEVNTSAVIDWPTQSRSIEIAANGDGTLSIFGVLFDAAVPPNPRNIDWLLDDPTDETALSDAARIVNEDWLASFGREVAANDPQAHPDAPGGAEDRNVELLIADPIGLTPPSAGTGPAPPPAFTMPPPPAFDLGSFMPNIPQNFPTGFPGGIGQQFQPAQPPFTHQDLQPPTVGGTEIGLGAPEPASTPTGARAGLLFLGALAGASWLFQARVRRFMVGI